MALTQITGQQRAMRFLKRLLEKSAVPHSFIFSGTAGAGKFAAAKEFAKALNCLDPQDFDSCGICNSCHKLEQGLHPDLVLVASDGVYIKLEQIRELRKSFRFRPFEGKFRVVIIQDAQKLIEQAANALLKILEEPPKANIFILLTPEPQMLLPTIVSRCCRVSFQPLDDESVAEFLARGGELPPDQAAEMARLAAGGIDKARLLAQDGRAAPWKEVIGKLESLDGLSILDFFPMVSDWAKNRETAERDFEFIRLWVRDIILFRLASGHCLTFELSGRSKEAARSASPESLFLLYRSIEQAMQGLKVNANLQMTLESVCLTIKDSLYGKGDWNSFSKRRQNLPF
jgi:DNA polymerase-3 subunit delta'